MRIEFLIIVILSIFLFIGYNDYYFTFPSLLFYFFVVISIGGFLEEFNRENKFNKILKTKFCPDCNNKIKLNEISSHTSSEKTRHKHFNFRCKKCGYEIYANGEEKLRFELMNKITKS